MLDNTTYNTFNQPNRLLRRLVIGLIAIAVIGILYWLSQMSFIAIQTTGGKDGTYEYALTDQKSNKVQTITGGASIKRFVKRGNFEITAQQDETNSFKVVKTGGFFGTTSVSLPLQKERERTFVGNNPASCYQLISGKLYSYNCSGDFSSINLHTPATATQATYTQPVPGNHEQGLVEGVTETKDGTVALVQLGVSDEGEEAKDTPVGHILYVVGDNLKVVRRIPLNELDQNNTFSLQASGSGLLFIPQGNGDSFRLANLSDKPNKIAKPSPKGKELVLLATDVKDNGSVFLYGKQPSNNSKPESEIIVANSSENIRFSSKNDYQKVSYCGEFICAIDNTGLTVFTSDGGKLKKTLHINSVINVLTIGQEVIVVRKGDSLMVDLRTGEGYAEYRYGSYTLNEAKASSNGYVLSLTSKLGKKVALAINRSAADNSSGLDKKIVSLGEAHAINDVSVYGKYIYISPNYGALVPNATGELDYDATTKQQVNNDIQQELTKLGLPPQGYSITNFLR